MTRCRVRGAAVVVALAVAVLGGSGVPSTEGQSAPVDDEPVTVVTDEVFTDWELSPHVTAAGSELRGLRDRFSASYETGIQGLVATRVFDEPVHFQSVSGDWRRIDTGLVERADGSGLRTRANSVRIDVAESADDFALASVRLPDQSQVSVRLEGASDASVAVDGSVAVFEDAQPGVDLHLEANPFGVKETIVLESVESPREFVFPLSLEGLVAELDEASGEVRLRDAPVEPDGEPGDVRLRVPPGWMEDSASGPEGPAYSEAVGYELVESADGPALQVTLDGRWLDDPARVWPVRVDPTFTADDVLASTDDTYVDSLDEGAGGHGGEDVLLVGQEEVGQDTHVRRSLLRFDVSNEAFAEEGVDIHWADVVLEQAAAGDCDPAQPMRLYEVEEAWAASTVAWPGPDVAADPLLGGSGALFLGGCPDGEVRGQITPLVEGWLAASASNHGVMLRAADEGDGGQARTLVSADDEPVGQEPDLRPYLEVAWTEPDGSSPDVPIDLSPQGEIDTLNPTFVARYMDQDEVSGSLFFEVRDGSSDLVLAIVDFVDGSGSPVVLGPGIRGAIVVGQGLPPGATLKWRAFGRIDDHFSPSPDWVTVSTPSGTDCAGTEDPDEQNDSLEAATPLEFSQGGIEGLICNDPDFYSLGENNGLILYLEILDGADLDMAVYDAATHAVIARYDSTDADEQHTLGNDPVIIEVYGYRGASGAYSIEAPS